jgi:actin-like ATPase involved in cell morphogenesis
MITLGEVRQAARIAADESGQAVVQIPLWLWEAWLAGEDTSDGSQDSASGNSPLKILIAVDLGEIREIVIHGQRVLSRRGHEGAVKLCSALLEYLKSERKLLVGWFTTIDAMKNIGSVRPLEVELSMEVAGRDIETGLPKVVELTSTQVQAAIADRVNWTVSNIALNLKYMVPQELHDILPTSKIVLTGEYGHLRGLDQVLEEATGLEVIVQ